MFCTSTQILSESWKTFHNRSPYRLAAGEPISPFQEVSAEVDKVMTDIHLHLQPAIHDIFKNRCLKPVTFILSLVPSIHEQIQQRKLLLLDFDSYKTKIQKEHAAGRDSSHPNVARKAVKLDESAKKLHSLQTTLSKTLDEFEIARPMTLGPELALSLACIHFLRQCTTPRHYYFSLFLKLFQHWLSWIVKLPQARFTQTNYRP